MNNPRQSLFIPSLLIILTIILLALPASSSTWGFAGWNYRKSHTINSATGAGTNYQVQLTVFYGSGTDASGNVYCNSKCKTDFGDIRFTASDGSGILNYWMQSSVTGNNAVFWIKVSADLGSSAQSIFVYYGNAGATTTSNAANTLNYFDDGTSVASWSVTGTAGSTSSQGNPQPSYYANGAVGNYLTRNAGLTTSTLTTFNILTQTTNLGNYFFLSNSSGAGQMYRLDARGGANYTGFATTTSWILWAAPGAPVTSSPNTWYKFAIAITSATSATLYYQATTDATPVLPSTTLGTFTITNSGSYIGLVGDGGGAALVTYWDNIITRKYVNPEPVHGSWSPEEPVMTLSISETDANCYLQPDGTATVSVTGGFPSNTYSWNSIPPQITATATGLPAGVYTVTVTDNLGLTATTSITVNQPGAVTTTVTSTTPVSCNGGSNGTITVTASGGNGTYSFSSDNGSTWTSGTSPYTFTGLNSTTNYYIRVKDIKGCLSPLIP
jgi:hypothetical protein